VDDAGLRGGATHVKGDRVLEAERVTERLGADDTGGGPRFQHAHTVALRLPRVVEAAGRLHDQERAGKTLAADVVLDPADISPDDGPDIGVGHHRRTALELAIFLRQFMRGRDEHVRMVLLQDRLCACFVVVPGIAVQKQDRGRLHAQPIEHAPEARDLRVVERGLDLAIGQHPLLHLESERPLDQWLVLAEVQIVSVRPVDAPDLVDVAEALGNKECGLGALALENGIDGDGRAMQKQPGGLVTAPGFFDPGIDAFDQTVRRRQRLAERQLAGSLIEDRDVGESAADVGRKTKVRAVGSGASALLHVQVSERCRGGEMALNGFPSPDGKGPDLCRGNGGGTVQH
jgi:hypothetical protein